MMRFVVMVFLLVVPVAFLGCANVEPPAQSRAPLVSEPAAEPPGPNDASVQVQEPSAAMPVDVPEIDADSGPAQVNESPAPRQETPDANVPSMPEPNDVAAVPEEKKGSLPAEAPSPLETSNLKLQTPFYDQYAEILGTYVRENGLVDYGELHRKRLELKAALTTLDELDPNAYRGWSKPQKLAFWINAYNLKMLDIIARNYPIESSWWLRLTWPPSDIRHIKGIWTDYRFLVMDEEFTLAEVEQRFFRRTFDDPRVWLALTYACQSSPPLRREPYGGAGSDAGVKREARRNSQLRLQGDLIDLVDPTDNEVNPVNEVLFTPRLDRQLDDQVRRFLASPQGLQIDRRNGVVRLSALFKPNWRGKEFIARYGTDKKFKAYDPATRAVLNFLTNYLSAEDVDFLEVENYSLEYLNFDWRLNDTSRGY